MTEMHIIIKSGSTAPKEPKTRKEPPRLLDKRPRHSSSRDRAEPKVKSSSLKSYPTPKGFKNKSSIHEGNPKAEAEQGRRLIERDDKKKHPMDKDHVTNVEALKEAMGHAIKKKKEKGI